MSRKIIILILGVLAVGIVLWLILRLEKSPAARLEKLWSESDVEKPNVILITLDTLRADHLACYGYSDVRTPHLDSLARQGVLFEQAATNSPLTLPAHCSILTGMYPTYHGVRINGNTALNEEQMTIAEVLSAQGYQCGAFIGAFVLDGRWGLKQGFQHYDDKFDLKKYKHLDLGAIQRPGNEVIDVALDWLEEQKSTPFFAWIHLYDPHTPYEPPEPYLSEYGPRGLAGLYDGEVAFMDEQIGRCLSWLENNGLDESTILILVGDHGEGLGSHGEGTHGYFIYDYAIHVPLIIVTPFDGLQGVRVSSQVRIVDIFPTLMEIAAITPPAETQGHSLLPLMFRPQKEVDGFAYAESMSPNLQFGWSSIHSLRTTQYKYIDTPKAELYDLTRDPDEQTNLLRQYPDIAREMKDALDRFMEETSRGAPTPQAANLDKETIERLSALGYIGAPVAAKKASGKAGPLADPKDKFPVFQAVTDAGAMVLKQKYAEAAIKLESALQEEPMIPQALLVLSTCYVELGRSEEAKAKLDLLLKEDPENVPALISIANILLEEKKDEDVITLCKQALSLDERNTQAHMLIGEIYLRRLKYSEALPYLEKAVEIQPKVTRSRFTLGACLLGFKQYDRAEVELKQVVQEAPKYPLAHFNLGLIYEETGRLEEAREAYTEEVANYPGEFKARFNLGKLLFKLGDRPGSLAQMREVVKITPKLAEGHLLLARGLLYEDVPLDEIQAEVENGLSLAETNELKALGYFLLADIYSRRQEPEKMNEALKKANAFKSNRSLQ
ncbi:MAG: sulfatase-like hydrolase/transferase [Candidatus Aminicenantes bacterium]|nr:sulfatase-like hydrolase/transferase [Candidatus Aminicenantes bacterium]